MGTIMNLVTPELDKLLYMGTMVELLGQFHVMQNNFAIDAISTVHVLIHFCKNMFGGS